MRNSTKAVAAGIAVAAIAAYGWKWRRGYKQRMRELEIEAAIRADLPYDVVGDFDLDLDEIGEFDAIAQFTCMQPCCYTQLSDEQVQEYGLLGEDDDGGLFLE